MVECCICLEPGKYKCPACERTTCLVTCVKQHKQLFSCSGQLDPTRFIERDDLSSSPIHLRRDASFLTNFKRHVDVSKDDVRTQARLVFKRAGGHHQQQQQFQQNKRLQLDPRVAKLKKVFPEAMVLTKRQNTMVVALPPGMARAGANKLGYDKKQGQYVWTIEWVLYDANRTVKHRFNSNRLRELFTWKQALPPTVVAREFPELTTPHFYLALIVGSGAVALDENMTIADLLKDQMVLEFPTILVAQSPDNLPADVAPRDGSDGSDGSSDDSSSDSDSDSSDSDSDDSDDSDDAPPEEALSAKPPTLLTNELDVDMDDDLDDIPAADDVPATPAASVLPASVPSPPSA